MTGRDASVEKTISPQELGFGSIPWARNPRSGSKATGGTQEKPVGLVYVAVGDGDGTEVEEHRFGTRGREFLKRLTSQAALALLWRRIRQS